MSARPPIWYYCDVGWMTKVVIYCPILFTNKKVADNDFFFDEALLSIFYGVWTFISNFFVCRSSSTIKNTLQQWAWRALFNKKKCGSSNVSNTSYEVITVEPFSDHFVMSSLPGNLFAIS